MVWRFVGVCFFMAFGAALPGCRSQDGSTAAPAPASSALSADPSEGSGEASGRGRLPSPPRPNTEAPAKLISASHILIQFKGAQKATTHRDRNQARRMAQGLLVRVQKGESLHELAREHSEGPSKGNGGYLGAFEETAMTPVFAKAVLSVDEEAVVPGLVETDFGYHVVRREKVLHLGHVLVAHREARNAHSGIQRSPQEAEKEAGRLRELLREGNRGEIAGKNSDCYRTKAIGGDLGYFGKGARGAKGGRLMPALIRAVAPLAPGELSGVVETEYGFHVLWRFAL